MGLEVVGHDVVGQDVNGANVWGREVIGAVVLEHTFWRLMFWGNSSMRPYVLAPDVLGQDDGHHVVLLHNFFTSNKTCTISVRTSMCFRSI